MMDELTRFIDAHSDEVFMLGPVDEAEIEAAEADLGYSLPQEVRAYVQRYGALSYGSVEFCGLGMRPPSHLHIVRRTRELRDEEGFPPNSVLLEDIGDGHFAVSLNDGSVIEWGSPASVGNPTPLSSSVMDYMMTRLRHA